MCASRGAGQPRRSRQVIGFSLFVVRSRRKTARFTAVAHATFSLVRDRRSRAVGDGILLGCPAAAKSPPQLDSPALVLVRLRRANGRKGKNSRVRASLAPIGSREHWLVKGPVSPAL